MVLRLYSQDGRARQLGRTGWSDTRLLLIAEWHRKSIDSRSFRVRAPDYADKGIRLQLNRNVFDLEDG